MAESNAVFQLRGVPDNYANGRSPECLLSLQESKNNL